MLRVLTRSLGLSAPLLLLTPLAPAPVCAQEPTAPATVSETRLGSTPNVHRAGDLFFSGQFGEADIESLKAQGIRRVLSARDEGEVPWDEQGALAAAGITFIRVPISGPESLDAETYGRIRDILQNTEAPTLFHCGSANRVGACWVPFRVLDEGVAIEKALEEAKMIGLRSEALRQRAIDYVAAERARRVLATGSERSVKEGINKPFKDPTLVPEEFLPNFEVESREVFAQRVAILDACEITEGLSIADIGAGTGLFTFPLVERTGADGFVYAVDIAPAFVARIVHSARNRGIRNLGGVVCAEDSVGLAPGSIDLAFVCDTYHHFEFPITTLRSLHSALRDGGRLLVVDFERIPGVTREWLLNHVRCGKEIVRSEIEAVGFEFVREVEIEGLNENYFLEFRRVAVTPAMPKAQVLERSEIADQDEVQLQAELLAVAGSADQFLVRGTMTLADGWHVYATAPASFPVTDWTGLEGEGLATVEAWQPRVESHPSKDFDDVTQFEGTIIFECLIEVSEGSPEAVEIEVAYQACSESTCLPPTSLSVELRLPRR